MVYFHKPFSHHIVTRSSVRLNCEKNKDDMSREVDGKMAAIGVYVGTIIAFFWWIYALIGIMGR